MKFTDVTLKAGVGGLGYRGVRPLLGVSPVSRLAPIPKALPVSGPPSASPR
jgi:hypothetical protein